MSTAKNSTNAPDRLVELLEAALAEADRRDNLPVAAHVAQALDLATRDKEKLNGE